MTEQVVDRWFIVWQARAQALQAKILEMSREDIDGGSEASSVLREQVAALMRMRESDQRVIEALKKHIAVKSVVLLICCS